MSGELAAQLVLVGDDGVDQELADCGMALLLHDEGEPVSKLSEVRGVEDCTSLSEALSDELAVNEASSRQCIKIHYHV
jgi:hypothetical protein